MKYYMIKEKLTPKKIAERNECYAIPIYQRLFEWEEDNINTLLSDLKNSYIECKDNDYYIGILTSKSNKDNKFIDLIDGQQRFVVMMLLGCVFQNYFPEWKKFILKKGEPGLRLDFTYRKKDCKYLKAIVMGKTKKINDNKMNTGIEVIKEFIENLRTEAEAIDIKDFAKYVYEHLSFFVSELTSIDEPSDLNTYFERMNTTGKNLEQQDILKVKLLRHLNKSEEYIRIWNKVADVDEFLIKRKMQRKNPESEDDFCKRKKDALKKPLKSIRNEIKEDDKSSRKSIKTIIKKGIDLNQPISKSEVKEEEHYYDEGESRALLKFPQLLLQALYWWYTKKKGEIKKNKDEFFKPSNLLDTFSKYLPYENNSKVNTDDIRSFMKTLVKCRFVLDICFIRMTKNENGYDYDYDLDMDMDMQKDKSDFKEKLKMFESMLYVSSSDATNYRWFGWLMDYVDKVSVEKLSSEGLFQHLKDEDNKFHKKDKKDFLPKRKDFSYKNIDRYWFWRLDYYLWERRKESDFFGNDKKALKVAENYVFRQNRSIEHIAPQNPKSHSKSLTWYNNDKDKTLKDCFGNLAMISSGLNSSLSNESFEVKKAHVKSYYNGSTSGSIESLKLLYIYVKYREIWNKKNIEDHEKDMFEILKESFAD